MSIEDELKEFVLYTPHADVRCGHFFMEAGTMVSKLARIDLTGDVTIGRLCMIGEGTQIFTHDHYHEGREPLLLLQQKKGVKWQDKVIGNDVWLHGCTILYQVTHISDGVVVGVGSILTKNPGPYEIWSGNPAIPTDVRSKYQEATYADEVPQELASYISGFVDGEGTFCTERSQSNNGKSSRFRFALESDARDRDLYLDISRVFGCGQLYDRRRPKHQRMTVFTIRSLPELITKVIPFFDTWKLRGLKRVKYRHWRENVLDYVVNNDWSCKQGSGKRDELLQFITKSFNYQIGER
jgi:acetyltransferase-like isoleucine patch superfamily enzyme